MSRSQDDSLSSGERLSRDGTSTFPLNSQDPDTADSDIAVTDKERSERHSDKKKTWSTQRRRGWLLEVDKDRPTDGQLQDICRSKIMGSLGTCERALW